MPASSFSPTLPVVADNDGPTGLLEVLALVVDPRRRRGVRHRLTSILAVALCATLDGARTFVAIGEWAADATPEALAASSIAGPAPSETAIRRCLQQLAPDTFDAVIGSWMWLRTTVSGGRRVIAFDGKTLRGARDAAGNLPHLLAGLCQRTGAAIAQLAVDAKTNEIPKLRQLLASIDIAGMVISADAFHCQRETATDITEAGGHYIFTVKGNQPTLRAKLKSLPWKQIRSPKPAPTEATAESRPDDSRGPRSPPGSGSPMPCRHCSWSAP
ncbi:ISAs1 family transposase [Nocardia beijingensis]